MQLMEEIIFFSLLNSFTKNDGQVPDKKKLQRVQFPTTQGSIPVAFSGFARCIKHVLSHSMVEESQQTEERKPGNKMHSVTVLFVFR